MKKREPILSRPTLRERHDRAFSTQPLPPLLAPIDDYRKKKAIELYRKKKAEFYGHHPGIYPTRSRLDRIRDEAVAAIWGPSEEIPSDEYLYIFEWLDWADRQSRKPRTSTKKQPSLYPVAPETADR